MRLKIMQQWLKENQHKSEIVVSSISAMMSYQSSDWNLNDHLAIVNRKHNNATDYVIQLSFGVMELKAKSMESFVALCALLCGIL